MTPYLVPILSALAGMLGAAGIALLWRRSSATVETDAFRALTEGAHLMADISAAVKARAQAEHTIQIKAQGLEALAAYCTDQAKAARSALPALLQGVGGPQ